MIAGAFAQFAVSLAMSLIDWYMARKMIRDDERNEIAAWMQGNIDRANAYKASHPILVDDSDPFSDFVQRPESSTTAAKDNDTSPTGTKRPDKDS